MVRDMRSKAVLSVDLDGLNAYRDKMAQAEILKQNQERLGGVEVSINDIKSEMGELKDLMKQLIQRV